MKEFSVDLIIDKTFSETIEKANFNDDAEFENVYNVLCFDKDGMLIAEYEIEADDTLGAATATEEFFYEDYPNSELHSVRVFLTDSIQYDEYVFEKEEE